MPLSLRQLQYFTTVAEEGQMTRAARRLHVSQPALSQAISELQAQLGVRLLERHPRGVSLTPPGEAFAEKARIALAAVADADLTARSQLRADARRLEWGFTGTPPMVEAPELFDAFVAAHPEAEVSFRELSLPRETTASWAKEVDVALCYSPTPHPDVHMLVLRSEPRVVLAAKTHQLAMRAELTVAEVLDHTYCGTHPSLEPVRAGFWRLDDHRGGPAPNVTGDQALNPIEVLAVVSSGRAILTAPRSNAVSVVGNLTGVVAIPLRDARPSPLALVWRRDGRNPLVGAVAAIATSLTEQDGRTPPGSSTPTEAAHAH